jgi:hypothetical protein
MVLKNRVTIIFAEGFDAQFVAELYMKLANFSVQHNKKAEGYVFHPYIAPNLDQLQSLIKNSFNFEHVKVIVSIDTDFDLVNKLMDKFQKIKIVGLLNVTSNDRISKIPLSWVQDEQFGVESILC